MSKKWVTAKNTEKKSEEIIDSGIGGDTLIRFIHIKPFRLSLFWVLRWSTASTKNTITGSPAFTVTVVDFTKALFIRDINGHESKVYICLFTCASKHVIHLEVIQDLTEKSFLQAFKTLQAESHWPDWWFWITCQGT